MPETATLLIALAGLLPGLAALWQVWVMRRGSDSDAMATEVTTVGQLMTTVNQLQEKINTMHAEHRKELADWERRYDDLKKQYRELKAEGDRRETAYQAQLQRLFARIGQLEVEGG